MNSNQHNHQEENHEIWRKCQNCGEETDLRKSPYCSSCGNKVKFFIFSKTFFLLSSVVLAIHTLSWIIDEVEFNFWILILFLFFMFCTVASSFFINDGFRA